jgi:Ca2+-binding RTX toxin-like protein
MTQTVSGPSGLTVSHVYQATGNFTVRVTAVDAGGDASTQAATRGVNITPTALVYDPATNTTTALAIGCPAGGGTVVIGPTDATGMQVAVRLNGTAQTLPNQTVTQFTHLFVFGQGGNDTVQVVTGQVGNQTVPVAVPALLFGGGGVNTLSVAGSSANNVLVGGKSRNALTGGSQGQGESGRDILIGGGGPGVLQAGSGGDILIGGSTAYDANVAALETLVAEWGRTDIGYAQRVQDLFGGGPGALNGTNLLNTQTVARDVAANQLVGGAGTDWFWLSESATGGDAFRNVASGEVLSLAN